MTDPVGNNSFWLWRWLLHRLSQHQSLSTTTVLFRTTFTQTLILNQLTFCSIYILCWRWDLQDAVCIWYKISSDKINFCLAGKNNLSYIIIVRTVPDGDLEIRERGRSSRPLDNGGGGGGGGGRAVSKKFLLVLWVSWQFGLKIGGGGRAPPLDPPLALKVHL